MSADHEQMQPSKEFLERRAAFAQRKAWIADDGHGVSSDGLVAERHFSLSDSSGLRNSVLIQAARRVSTQSDFQTPFDDRLPLHEEHFLSIQHEARLSPPVRLGAMGTASRASASLLLSDAGAVGGRSSDGKFREFEMYADPSQLSDRHYHQRQHHHLYHHHQQQQQQQQQQHYYRPSSMHPGSIAHHLLNAGSSPNLPIRVLQPSDGPYRKSVDSVYKIDIDGSLHPDSHGDHDEVYYRKPSLAPPAAQVPVRHIHPDEAFRMSAMLDNSPSTSDHSTDDLHILQQGSSFKRSSVVSRPREVPRARRPLLYDNPYPSSSSNSASAASYNQPNLPVDPPRT
eukprot:ANDGO_02504.mRNA.1 hypothetical protein